jgi:hypothetical protein
MFFLRLVVCDDRTGGKILQGQIKRAYILSQTDAKHKYIFTFLCADKNAES